MMFTLRNTMKQGIKCKRNRNVGIFFESNLGYNAKIAMCGFADG